MVWRLISNNGHSILVNGQPNGFFKSTRGLKQGNSLSPTLFIIATEVLTRGLNSLRQYRKFIGYGLPKQSPAINHLSYADDTILFCCEDRYSVIQIMKVLKQYEDISRQLINKSKSFFYLHENTPLIYFIRLRKLTSIRE